MSDKEREALFQLGVDAVRQLTGTTDDVYVCPICGSTYDRSALEDRILTKEHVPPSSQNGHVLILTCKECNNRSGSILDKAVADRQITLNFTEALVLGRSNYTGRVKFQLADQPLNVWADIGDGKVSVSFMEKVNDPKNIRKSSDQLETDAERGTWEGREFKLSPPRGFHARYAEIGDLKSAYLAVFALLGYTWGFRSQLNAVRDQILHPDEELIKGFWQFPGWDSPEERWILLTETPTELILVKLGRIYIYLPSPNSPLNFYKELPRIHPHGSVVKFHGKFVKWPTRLYLQLDFMSHNTQ